MYNFLTKRMRRTLRFAEVQYPALLNSVWQIVGGKASPCGQGFRCSFCTMNPLFSKWNHWWWTEKFHLSLDIGEATEERQEMPDGGHPLCSHGACLESWLRHFLAVWHRQITSSCASLPSFHEGHYHSTYLKAFGGKKGVNICKTLKQSRGWHRVTAAKVLAERLDGIGRN